MKYYLISLRHGRRISKNRTSLQFVGNTKELQLYISYNLKILLNNILFTTITYVFALFKRKG